MYNSPRARQAFSELLGMKCNILYSTFRFSTLIIKQRQRARHIIQTEGKGLSQMTKAQP